ncbi:MAG: hypothetical protein ACK5Q5_21085 [Planctomycetaceae bacterium]
MILSFLPREAERTSMTTGGMYGLLCCGDYSAAEGTSVQADR